MNNGMVVKLKRKGMIVISSKKGQMLTYDILLYVPNLAQNLLSVRQLIKHSHAIHFEDEWCKIYDKIEN